MHIIHTIWHTIVMEFSHKAQNEGNLILYRAITRVYSVMYHIKTGNLYELVL
jgi:hypothetical protein